MLCLHILSSLTHSYMHHAIIGNNFYFVCRIGLHKYFADKVLRIYNSKDIEALHVMSILDTWHQEQMAISK